MERLEIINAVRREVEGVEQGGFPLRVFPQTMQKIILDWEHDEGYVVEFSAMAMMSALSTALGNALHIRVRSQWTSNASLYCIFVGRPGLGKTPPLEAAFAPIRKKDAELMREYCSALELYEASKGKDSDRPDCPRLARYIVNDFTPEAMFEAHHNNLRGIVILVDEIIGMFNSANRYTSGQLIEQLLSAWSGTSISIIRKSNPKPLYIGHPCINIIGTIQTTIVGHLFKKGYGDNGLLDRIIFIYPKSSKIKRWTKDTCSKPNERNTGSRWSAIIDKVLSLAMPESEDGTRQPKVIGFDEQGQDCYYDWWNSCVDAVNNVENDADIETRTMKRNTIVARLALLFQVARWACGEGHIQFVDAESVRSAIALNEYIEDCYSRVKLFVTAESPVTGHDALLRAMQESFTTQEAQNYGRSAGISVRTVQNWLQGLLSEGKIAQVKKGLYRKQTQPSDGCPTESAAENAALHIADSAHLALAGVNQEYETSTCAESAGSAMCNQGE